MNQATKLLSTLTTSLLLASLAAAAPNDSDTEATLLPSAYKTLLANDDVTITWGGRLYWDNTFIGGDKDSFPTDDFTEFRTARLFAAGTLFDTIEFKSQWDLAGGDTDAKDVYIVIPTPFGKIKVGHFKEPMGLEELTSSRFTTFTERSLANTFIPGRNAGIMYSDQTEDAGVNWAVGLFRDVNDYGMGAGDGEYAVTGRLAGHAWYEDDGASVLHWGVSASSRGDTGGIASFSADPEAHLPGSVASTGDIASDGTTLAALEAAWVQGPLSFQGEYTTAAVSGDGVADADYAGYYVLGSYFLTGEHRHYKAKGAKFDRVKPSDNYDGHGLDGAFEVTGRLSNLDLNDGASMDELTDMTLGLNWYLNPNTRVMLNYIRANFESGAVDDNADILMVRFQVDW